MLRRFSWSRVILLKVLLCSIGASGQLALSSSASYSNLNFGSVQVGSSSTLSISASNTGKSNLTITQAAVSGIAFSYKGPSLPVTVAPGQNVRLAAAFTPQSLGAANGSMSVVTSTRIGNRNRQRYSTTTISLAGTGTAPVSGTPATPGFLAASPFSMNFGSIQVANSQMLYETVTNSGGSSCDDLFGDGDGRRVQPWRLHYPADSGRRAKPHVLRLFCPELGRDSEWNAYASVQCFQYER